MLLESPARPSVLLPESLEACRQGGGGGWPPAAALLAPSAPVRRSRPPVSPECVHAAVVGPERFRAVASSAAGHAHPGRDLLLPPRAGGII